jgi:hypothetical protein
MDHQSQPSILYVCEIFEMKILKTSSLFRSRVTRSELFQTKTKMKLRNHAKASILIDGEIVSDTSGLIARQIMNRFKAIHALSNFPQ